jgi:putative ABC transport system permease protein
VDALLQDLKFAVRTLLKAPLVSGLAIVCLALGIGANAAMFSVFDGILIKPLPFKDPHRIVVIAETNQRNSIDDSPMSYPNFEDMRDRARTITDIAAFTGRTLTFMDGTEAVRHQGAVISWNLFDLLGVAPAIGRNFRAEDDRPGAPGTVLLSDAVWRARYHGDPSIVGRTIIVNDAPHTVIGIMPPRFAFPQNGEAWIPISQVYHQEARSAREVRAYGRLAPGASFAQGDDEARAIAASLASQYGDNEGWSARLMPLRDDLLPDQPKLVTTAAMGAVSLVLLIACANVANLLLARASARQREMAVRTAVGAGRSRIIRQLLTESVVLGAAATPLGVVLTIAGVKLLDAGIPSPDSLPYYITWSVDARVVMYVVAIAVASGVLFGLAPAFQTMKTSLVESLKDGARGSGVGGQRGRFRAALVVAEVALSLILLVGAALFVRSFLNLQTASAGFDATPILTLRFYMPGDRYKPEGTIARRVEDVVRRIESVPGVRAAAASNYIPLAFGGDGGGVIIDGRPSTPGEEPQVGWAGVTPHFLRTLGVSLRSGRDFTDAEGQSRARVAIVNATMAARFWPNKDAVGQRFRLVSEKNGDWFTVIGVAPDVARGFIGSRPFPWAFLPHPFGETPNTGVIVNVAGDPTSVLPAIRREIRAADASMPVFQVQTMNEARERGYWQYRLFSWMFSVFGAIALALAAVGVYGVLAYSVSQRAHEIGVRMALGARSTDVVRMIAGQGLKLAALGVIVGAVGAAGVTQGLRTILFNVSATDPVSYAGVALFLVGVAMAAAWLPARRATRVDPIIALRAE